MTGEKKVMGEKKKKEYEMNRSSKVQKVEEGK